MPPVVPQDAVRLLLTGADPTDLAARLLAEGVIEPRDVVDGDVAIRRGGGRGAGNVRIERTTGPAVFLKRATSPGHRARLGHEARMLARLARHGVGDLIVPACHADEDRGVLVTPIDDRERDLLRLQARGVASASVGRAVGRALARVHELPAHLGAEALGDGRPAILDIARTGIHEFLRLGPGGAEALAIAQRSGATEAVEVLSDDWEAHRLIHGDVRPANILVGPGDPPGIRFIDWEFAAGGDPCWDVGSLLGHVVSRALDAARGDRDEPSLEAVMGLLEEVPRFAGALWRSYVNAGGAAADVEGGLTRTVSFAGAALLDIAISLGRDAPELSRSQVIRLQVAHNVLRRPRAAAAGFFGLAASEGP